MDECERTKAGVPHGNQPEHFDGAFSKRYGLLSVHCRPW